MSVGIALLILFPFVAVEAIVSTREWWATKTKRG